MKNKRCPFQSECDRRCSYEGRELSCDYYKNNALGERIIEDQERIREQMESARMREIEEEIYDSEEGGLVMLPVDVLYPHPDNPRKKLGDLSELAASIKAKGVMQNLTVVPKEGSAFEYTIIIGHRRHAAAKKAGLREVPCVVVNMSAQEQLATMLLENIQRSDLTAYEQAKGFQLMMDFGDSVAGIVEKTGFSETTVRRRLKMAELDEKMLEKVSARQISLGDIDKLSEIEDIEVRNKVLADVGTANFNNSYRSAVADQKRAQILAKMRGVFADVGLCEVTWNEYHDFYNYDTSISDPEDVERAATEAAQRGATAYYFSYNTTFYTLIKKGDKKEAQKSAEQLAREEAERERRERRDKLVEAFQKAYELRRDFIDTYSLKQAVINLDKIAAFFACMSANEDINYGINKEDFEKLVFGRECEVSSYEEMQGMIESSSAAKAMLVAVWLITDDENDNCCDNYGGFDENECLNMVYEFLESIGYEMSDEECELLDGTHELYRKEGE